MASKTNQGNDRLPFDPMMCMDQFAAVLGFVEHMQGDARINDACAEAERRCAELFGEFYKSDDRTAYLAMLGYLAMDISANVAYTLDRAHMVWDLEGGTDDR